MCFPIFVPSRTPKRLFFFSNSYKPLRKATYTGKKKVLPVILGSRPDHGYGRWLDRQITYGWINSQVIRLRAKYILAYGTEIIVPRWEVRPFWPYCCEELLLGLWSYCCEELRVWSLLDVKTCSSKPTSRKHVVSDRRVRQTGKKKPGRLNKTHVW